MKVLSHQPLLTMSLTAFLLIGLEMTIPKYSHAEKVLQMDKAQHQEVSPHVVEMALSQRQKALFVASPDMAGKKNWEVSGESYVLRLDPVTLKVQKKIPLDGKGLGLTLDDEHDRLYISQGFNGAIAVVDTKANKQIATIKLQPRVEYDQFFREQGVPDAYREKLNEFNKRLNLEHGYGWKLRELAVDPKRQLLFAPALGIAVDSVVYVVDTATLQLKKTIPGFGYNVVGVTTDPAGGRVFVSNMQGQLFTINADTLEISSKHEIDADQLLNLVYNPKNKRLFGVDQGIDRNLFRNTYLGHTYKQRSKGYELMVIEPENGNILAQLPTGEVPIGLVLDATNQRLYVANRGGVRTDEGKGSISVFDVANNKKIEEIPLRPHPNSVVLDHEKKHLYVTVKNPESGEKQGGLEQVYRIPLKP